MILILLNSQTLLQLKKILNEVIYAMSDECKPCPKIVYASWVVENLFYIHSACCGGKAFPPVLILTLLGFELGLHVMY